MCSVIDILENADPCNPNIGGTQDEIYYALLSDFSALPEPPVSETDLEDKFLITTGITFKTGKCWKKIQANKESGKLSYESVGNAGAKQAALMFAIPGNNLQGQLLHNLSDNFTPYVFLVQRNSMPAGRFDIIGGKKHKATMKGSMAGGETAGDGGLYNFEVRSTAKFEVHYSGSVSFTPAS